MPTRKAVVVGASSGMGRAVAIRLREQGYQLVLADLDAEKLAQLAAQLDAQSRAVDVTDDEAIAALVASSGTDIDALIVTAGVSMTMAPFEKILDINLLGTNRLLNAFAPVMRAHSAAVCFASIAGHLTVPDDARVTAVLDDPSPGMVDRLKAVLPAAACIPGMAYGLSKLGVLRLVKRKAVEFGPKGIRVCSISPGCIDTAMGTLERDRSPSANEAVELAPIPRLGSAEEVANVAAFLCSPEASYVTACDILVDGGWVGAIEMAGADSPFARALAAGRDKT